MDYILHKRYLLLCILCIYFILASRPTKSSVYHYESVFVIKIHGYDSSIVFITLYVSVKFNIRDGNGCIFVKHL